MIELAIALAWPATAVATVVMLCFTVLRVWRGWLELKRERGSTPPDPGARIEMADVRERLRKLEAIARGVDL